MYALIIMAHPRNAQPHVKETVATVPPERAGDLVRMAQERGFNYVCEVLGRYLFDHPDTRDTAQIGPAR